MSIMDEIDRAIARHIAQERGIKRRAELLALMETCCPTATITKYRFLFSLRDAL